MQSGIGRAAGSHEGAERATRAQSDPGIEGRSVFDELAAFWAGVPKHGTDRDEAIRWLLPELHTVASYAQLCGMTPAFDPEPGMLVETAAEWAAPGVDGLSLALDSGQCLVT